MAKLAGVFCTPHIPLIASQPNVAPKKKVEAVMNAFAHISDRIQQLDIDTAIVIGDDHYTVFGPHCLPNILIGVGDVDGPYEDWLGHDRAPIDNNEALAEHILNYGLNNGFDWAMAKSLTVDHSTFVPYLKIIKELDGVKMIPVYINAGVLPLIRTRRCVQLGEMLADAVEAYEGAERVAIIGTGGLSHWVGAANMGKVNEEFDHNVLEMIKTCDVDGLVALSDDYVLREAGNGALEFRNWLVAIGAARKYHYEMDLICYEPIPQWVTGTALVELKFAA